MNILRVFIYLARAPLRTSVTLLGIRVFRLYLFLRMVVWIFENISQPDPSADDPKMAQLEELNSEGCRADDVWFETGLKSAGNSAFSRRERSFWGAFLKD